MKNILIAFVFTILGFVIGLVISPIGNQHTEITIKTNEKYTDYNFKSNRLKDGDTYLIIKDRDTVASGIVVKGNWE